MSNTANWLLAVSGTKECQTISGLVRTRGHLIMLRHAIDWNLRGCLLWLIGVESSNRLTQNVDLYHTELLEIAASKIGKAQSCISDPNLPRTFALHQPFIYPLPPLPLFLLNTNWVSFFHLIQLDSACRKCLVYRKRESWITANSSSSAAITRERSLKVFWVVLVLAIMFTSFLKRSYALHLNITCDSSSISFLHTGQSNWLGTTSFL